MNNKVTPGVLAYAALVGDEVYEVELSAKNAGQEARRIGGRMVELVDAAAAATQWSRGYYCAVAVLLRVEGCVTADVRDLFNQGGGAAHADQEDIELFRQHGLMA